MMKKYRNNILKVGLVIGMLFGCLTPLEVRADEAKTLGDLRKIYEDLLAQKQANDNKTEAAKADIAKKEAAIKQAEADISAAEEEHEEAELAIAESNEKIEELTQESEKVLLYLQQVQGQNAYIEYISGATSMTEMVTRIEAVKQVTSYIQDTMNNLEVEIENNEKLKVELEEKQKKLENQVVSYQAVIAEQYENIDSYDKYALGIDEKLQTAKDNYEANKKICQQNLGKTDDSVLLSDCSKVPVNGSWMKPLKSGVITSTVGARWGSYHNALDIGGNSEGTPVYAAAAGQVVGKINRYRCGGNMLYVNVTVNGVKYTTYYYHLLKFNVNVGDIVDQNTILGYVGGYSTSTTHGGYDGCTTGAHLHFGVQKGWYNSSTGIVRSQVIVPPGFPNTTGYRFTSRLAYYGK